MIIKNIFKNWKNKFSRNSNNDQEKNNASTSIEEKRVEIERVAKKLYEAIETAVKKQRAYDKKKARNAKL